MSYSLFSGRRLVIASMHGKERVIAPGLEKSLGVDTLVSDRLNTDLFGTFSGELPRSVGPLEAARAKCRMACALHQCSLAVASEGSFGPHPEIPFIPCDDEIIVLMDLRHNFEIKARTISTTTNFASARILSWPELEAFAHRAQFPSHGLILRTAADSWKGMLKGILDWNTLEKHAKRLLQLFDQLYVETDMRAMFNPTRMKIIEETTRKLIAIAQQLCPKCGCPGFEVRDASPGLPCEECGNPTRSTLSRVYGCWNCTFHEEKKFPHGKLTESAQFCDICNP